MHVLWQDRIYHKFGHKDLNSSERLYVIARSNEYLLSSHHSSESDE